MDDIHLRLKLRLLRSSTVGCRRFGQNLKLVQEIACSCQMSRVHVNLLHATCSFFMRSLLAQVGVECICVVLCCLAAEKSRGLARETEEALLLLFKGLNEKAQAQVPFLHYLGAVTYRPDEKQVQG